MPLRFRILSPPAVAADGAVPTGQTLAERTFELTEDTAEVRLGRQPSFEIELPFPAVSAYHARMFRGESAHEWWLEDQGSTNGTWLEGTRLAPRRPVLIGAGQRIRIGSVEIVFEGWAPTVKGGESTATIARRLISDMFSAPGNDVPVLVLEAGRAAPAVLRLPERDHRYLAGRADTCDLVIGDDQASREHASFERRWDGVFLTDLGSRNGVQVNGASVREAHRLRDGDSVRLGGVTLRMTDPEDRYLRRLEAEGEQAPDVAMAAPAVEPPVSDAPARNAPSAATRSAAAAARAAPPSDASASRRGATAPGPALSARRKAAMALAAGVLVIAVAGLILLLIG